MVKKNEKESSPQQSKIRKRVLSTEGAVSKIRGRVFSIEEPVSKIRERVFSPDASGSKMAALLADQGFAPRLLTRGESIDGKIVAILSDVALLDIGAKAEAVLPLKEIQEMGEEPVVGAKITSIIAQTEGDSGTIILTIKKTIKEKTWEQLEELADLGEVVDVKGIGNNRGGLIVEFKEVRGFIPSSHLVTDARNALGKNLQVKAIQVDKNLNKLVFSEREATSDQLPKIELPFKIGDSLKTKIVKILPFGLLVGIPSGQEGLIHISEISWKKVSSLNDAYKIGQELQAKVITIDNNTGKINLSIKQLEEDPWKEAAKQYKVGAVFERPVSRITSYGVFVELEEGIEGLLHSSKIPYGLELKEGEMIKVSIDLFNSEQRRVALRLAPEEEKKDKEELKKKETKTSKAKKTTSKGKDE